MRPRDMSESGLAGFLMSRIEIGGTLITRFQDLKNDLEANRSMTLLKEGTSLLYTIEEKDADNHFYSIEFLKDRMALIIYSKQTPVTFMSEALLRLLSIAQLTSEHYELKLSSLYPYLIVLLAGHQMGNLSERIDDHVQQDGSDLILARRIIGLLNENNKLKEDSAILSHKFERVLLKCIVFSSTGRNNTEEIANTIGIDESEVCKAMPDLYKIGHKAVYLDRKRFSISKL